MIKLLLSSGALLILLTGQAQAEEAVTCRGSVTSKQGEGLVVKTFRFEVADVTGSDMNDILEKCRKIVQQRQNKAGRANPALGFRKLSDLDLDCTKGSQKFQVRRTLQTAP
jgi:hypothetical protein